MGKRIEIRSALLIVFAAAIAFSSVAWAADEAATATEAPAAVSAEPAKKAADTQSVAKAKDGIVTVNFKSADIRTVLSYLSEVSGVDIVPSPEVKGLIDLKLTDKPWRTALDIVSKNYGYAYEDKGNIIRVIPIAKLKEEEATTQVFTLNYANARDVALSISNMWGRGDSTEYRYYEVRREGDRPEMATLKLKSNIAYDLRTNTVTVKDVPTNLYKIGEIIKKLDKKTEQVLIEARILETTLNKDEKLGIDWTVKISATGAKRPTTFPFSINGEDSWLNRYYPLVQTGTPTVTASPGGQTTTVYPGPYPTGGDGSRSFPYIDYNQLPGQNPFFSDAFSYGTLDFSQLSAVLELLRERRDVDVVSNPRIATLNNAPAQIKVGETLSMPTYERNSNTGKMEITGYESTDLGIILTVKPQINENGEIVVDLLPTIRDLLRYDILDRVSGIVAPVFATREAKTQVMIKDGDTIFIGGLIRETKNKRDKKLPFLGDAFGNVPYLGLLVKRTEDVVEKKELIFFITVNRMTVGTQLPNAPQAEQTAEPKFTIQTEPAQGTPTEQALKKVL